MCFPSCCQNGYSPLPQSQTIVMAVSAYLSRDGRRGIPVACRAEFPKKARGIITATISDLKVCQLFVTVLRFRLRLVLRFLEQWLSLSGCGLFFFWRGSNGVKRKEVVQWKNYPESSFHSLPHWVCGFLGFWVFGVFRFCDYHVSLTVTTLPSSKTQNQPFFASHVPDLHLHNIRFGIGLGFGWKESFWNPSNICLLVLYQVVCIQVPEHCIVHCSHSPLCDQQGVNWFYFSPIIIGGIAIHPLLFGGMRIGSWKLGLGRWENGYCEALQRFCPSGRRWGCSS